MSKKLKLFFVIVLIVSIIFLILFFFLKDLDLVWRIIYGSVGFIGSIASIVGLIKSESKQQPPSGKTYFDIISIYRSDDIITVNFMSKYMYEIKDVKVSVGIHDICKFDNPEAFPITRLQGFGQFYVNLYLRSLNSERTISDITIKCKPSQGDWLEVRHIDINKLVEVQQA